MDTYTLLQCQKSNEILDLKIKTLEHGISQTEAIIGDSNMDQQTLAFLRRKIAQSLQDLEMLYLVKEQFHKGGKEHI